MYNNKTSSRKTIVGPKLSRVVWNEKGWVFPSGSFGKSTNAGNHEHDYGYGYEEWLLDTNKCIDGYHYGFLQPFNQYFDLYKGNTIADIYLYTIHYPSRKRYWVAHLRDVEILNQSECDFATEEYRKRGWLEEMRQQVETASSRPDFSGHHNGRIVHLRYKPDERNPYSPLIPVNHNHPVYKLHRFKLYDATGMELPD
jgi:hypothetical protein